MSACGEDRIEDLFRSYEAASGRRVLGTEEESEYVDNIRGVEEMEWTEVVEIVKLGCYPECAHLDTYDVPKGVFNCARCNFVAKVNPFPTPEYCPGCGYEIAKGDWAFCVCVSSGAISQLVEDEIAKRS